MDCNRFNGFGILGVGVEEWDKKIMWRGEIGRGENRVEKGIRELRCGCYWSE